MCIYKIGEDTDPEYKSQTAIPSCVYLTRSPAAQLWF